MVEKGYCFCADRTCHHDEYCDVIRCFAPVRRVKRIGQKIRALFTSEPIFFLDIDQTDLLYVPLIIMRSLWGGRGVGISVRSEYLLQCTSLVNFFRDPLNDKTFHTLAKRWLFLVIKHLSRTKIISIHKDHPEKEKIDRYVDAYVFDPQLWDVPILKTERHRPPEYEQLELKPKTHTVLIPGRLNEQRSRKELLAFLTENRELHVGSHFHYVFAGELHQEDDVLLRKLPYCTVINRFISNEELLYLLANSDLVYCFYTNDRPSGFFGRSVQLAKPIIVRADPYLATRYPLYLRLIKLKGLNELHSARAASEDYIAGSDVNPYDDSKIFAEVISNTMT